MWASGRTPLAGWRAVTGIGGGIGSEVAGEELEVAGAFGG